MVASKAMEATKDNLVLHFGCRGQAGHYLTFPSGRTVRDFESENLLVPRAGHLDGSSLFLPRPEVVGTGALTYLPASDRTILAWWDRTFDGRPGCNMAVIVDGKADVDGVWRRFAQLFTDLEPQLKRPTVIRGLRESRIDAELETLGRRVAEMEPELQRLEALINNPHTADFTEAVRTEAAHQRERWGAAHDDGKGDEDWFWLIGYLAGKALHTPIRKDLAERLTLSIDRPSEAIDLSAESLREKQLHRIITIGAAALNWHAAAAGIDNRMRPGTEAPTA